MTMNTIEQTLTIGQLAEETGLTRRAIRLYEQASLLEPLRDDNNYRLYTERHVELALVIRDMRASGISLKQIKEIIQIKSTNMPARQKLESLLPVLEVIRSELQERQRAIAQSLEQVEFHHQEAIRRLDELSENEETSK